MGMQYHENLKMHWLRAYLFFLLSLLVLVVASLLWFRKWRTLPLRLPPGPPSFPIIGNLHLLGSLPHRSLSLLSQSYGPLMSLRLGSVPVLVVSSSSMASEILKTQDRAFASRPRNAAAAYLSFDGKGIAFAPYGPHLRRVRQLCNTTLFSPKGLQAFTASRAAEIALLVRSVHEDSMAGKETQVASKLLSAANNVTSMQLFGKRYTELLTSTQDSLQNVVPVITEIMQLLCVFNIGDFIPYLQWMDLQSYVKRMKIVGKKFQLFFQDIINARRELRKGKLSAPKDLLDVLLSASRDSKPDAPITDDSIKAVLQDLFLAGTETTSILVEWALAEMLNNPTIMKKLQAELHDVVGSERLVQESDIAQLPYLRAVVKETMRLHPPGPLLLPRESMEPCRVAGYNIPAKTQVYVNTWAIGRDANDWKIPLDFWPERFLESSIDVLGHHFQLLPFGAGRRVCPGLVVGLPNVQMMVASLVQGFDWRLPSSCRDGFVDMSECFGLSLKMASPIVAQATPRLPTHVYLEAGND